jgi:hypothetical protein
MLLASLREQEKAPRTIRNIHSTLRSLFNDLIDEEIVDALRGGREFPPGSTRQLP